MARMQHIAIGAIRYNKVAMAPIAGVGCVHRSVNKTVTNLA